jgi:ABC-type transport system involved in multi-copper enzyme maturation permease subunit
MIKKDLYANFQETKIQALAITALCLTLIVSVLGIFEYKFKNEKYLTEQQSDLEQLYENKIYATIHPQAIMPPTPLAIISKGVEQNFGNSYRFDLLTIPYSASRIYESNLYIDGFINLDLSLVFIWLFSLISILVAHDSVSKERESGTLKLIFVSLSKTKFFFSKIISSFLSVFFVVFISISIVAIVFLISPWIEFNSQIISALLLLFVLTLLFVLFWISIGSFFSTIFNKSSQSLVASLAVWIILLLAFPTAIKTILGDTNFVNEKKEIAALQQDIMNEYYKKRGEIIDREIYPLIRDLQFSTFGGSPHSDQGPMWGANPPTLQAAIKLYNTLNPMKDDIANRNFAIANEKYLIPLQKKIQLNDRLAYFSPVSLFEQTGMKIAGTSYNDQFSFLNNFKIYRNQIIDFFVRRSAFDSRFWFTPEAEYYPYSPGHPLCPVNPVKPTEEELDKLGEYYEQIRQEDSALDLNDFPVFNVISKKPEVSNDIAKALTIMLILSGIIFLFGMYRMKQYNFE